MKSWDKEWCLLSYIKIPVASLQITAYCWQRASPFTVKQPWWSVSSPKIRPPHTSPKKRKVNREYNTVCSFHGRSNIQGSGTGPTRRGKPASRTPAGMDGQKWYVIKKKKKTSYIFSVYLSALLEKQRKTGTLAYAKFMRVCVYIGRYVRSWWTEELDVRLFKRKKNSIQGFFFCEKQTCSYYENSEAGDSA